MNKENIKKVVLAYSGGLDTSIIIPWLKENYNNCVLPSSAAAWGLAIRSPILSLMEKASLGFIGHVDRDLTLVSH